MRQVKVVLSAGLLAALLPTAAAAGNLTINLPWVRVSPDARSAQAYARVTSDENAKLVSVSSFAARSVSLRSPDAARKAVNTISLPAGTLVALEPGGYHIALDKLVRPLKLGEHVPITLTIESADGKRSEVLVGAEVRLRSVIEDEMQPHHH